MIAVLFFASLQQDLDAARVHEAANTASVRERALLAFARCQPVPGEDAAALHFRLEQVRGARLTEAERQDTVWREVDALVFPSNVTKTDALIWPRERERWPGEAPHVAQEARACTLLPPAPLSTELAITEALAAMGEDVALHRAILAHRLGRPIPPLTETTPLGRLLTAERAYFDREASTDALRAALAIYKTLEGFDRTALRLREIAVAERLGEGLEHALRDDLEGDARTYVIALRMLRAENADAVLAEARRAWAGLQKGGKNRAIIDDLVRAALVERPFDANTITTLTELYGKAALERQVYRLATLAISRGAVETGRAALLWVAKGGSQKLARPVAARLGVVGLIVGDPQLVAEAAKTLGQDLPAAVEEWLLVARTSPLAKREALAPLLKMVQGPMLSELKELMAVKQVKVLKVVLEKGTLERPIAPEVELALPEVYSLLR